MRLKFFPIKLDHYRWTAEHIALRAIDDTDAFPEDDSYLNKIINMKDLDRLYPWRGYLTTTLYQHGKKK